MTDISPFVGFYKLRAAAVAVFRAQHTTIPENPESWSGRDIAGFVTDVEEKTGMRISERWMYSYFKKTNIERLPRTDMLDILCGYAGYDNWRSYYHQLTTDDASSEAPQRKNPINAKSVVYVLASITLIALVTVMGMWWKGSKENHLTICFTDNLTRNPVMPPVQIAMISGDNRRRILEADSAMCIVVPVDEESISLALTSPYYHNDTIEVVPDWRNSPLHIALNADVYALLIQYFISGNGESHDDRTDLLESILHDDLIAMEVDAESGMPVHLYNKASLMRRLLIGSESAAKMKIIYLTYQNHRIYELRYMQDSPD